MITGEELDKLLVDRGMLSITQRLEHSPLDGFMTTVEVVDLQTLYKWVVNTRRTYMEMQARHDLGLRVLGEDMLDFILGKNAMVTEFHLNLRKVLDKMVIV